MFLFSPFRRRRLAYHEQLLADAEDLLRRDRICAAGAVARMALEYLIRTAAHDHEIYFSRVPRLWQVVKGLERRQIIDRSTRRAVFVLLVPANDAAHGRSVPRADIVDLLKGIRDFQRVLTQGG